MERNGDLKKEREMHWCVCRHYSTKRERGGERGGV